MNGKSLGAGKDIVQDGKHQDFYLERIDDRPAEFARRRGDGFNGASEIRSQGNLRQDNLEARGI